MRDYAVFFWQFIRKLRSLQSFRRQLEGPCDHEGNGKTKQQEHDDSPHHPVWNFEEGKCLRGDLNEQPPYRPIGDRNFVNVAPLQLSEEVLRVHMRYFALRRTIFCTSSSTRIASAPVVEERHPKHD